MKKTAKRLTVFAMAAVMGIGSVAATGNGSFCTLFDDTTIVAEAAAAWYPSLSNFNLVRATNFAALSTNSPIRAELQSRFGSKITSTTGVYRNYRIIYCEPKSGSSFSDKVILLYDGSKRSVLNSNDTKIKNWMEKYLQFINTERHMSGISRSYLNLVLDAKKTDGSYISGYSDWDWTDSKAASFCEAHTQEIVDGITGFSTPYMCWPLLHESSHAYADVNQSVFISSDEVYTNLRTICAVRALKCNGATFPDILRPDSSGSLNVGGRKYIGSSVFQYACHDMAGDRQDYFLPNTLQQILNAHNGEGHKLFYAQLGMLFNVATGLTPWSPAIQTDRAYADELETYSSYSNGWRKLYTLCISNPNNVNQSFMSFAKSKYVEYKNKETQTVIVRQYSNWASTTQSATPNVKYALQHRFVYSQGYDITKGSLRAFKAYDFLFNEATGAAYNSHLNYSASGHSSINYGQVCDRIVGLSS